MIDVPILSVDPGSTCTGIALLEGPKVWAMTIRSLTAHDADHVLRTLASGARVKPILVIEMQHVVMHPTGRRPGAKGKRAHTVNWPSLVKLVESRCYWTTLAIAYGYEVIEVMASPWQGKMLSTVPRFNPDGSERTTKQRSKDVARSVWRSIPRIKDIEAPLSEAKPRTSDLVTYDESDACVMGRYCQLYGVRPAAPQPKPVMVKPAKAAKAKLALAPEPKVDS